MKKEEFIKQFIELFREDELRKSYVMSLKIGPVTETLSVCTFSGKEIISFPVEEVAESLSPAEAMMIARFKCNSQTWAQVKDRIFFAISASDNPNVMRLETIYDGIYVTPVLVSRSRNQYMEIRYSMAAAWGVSVKKLLKTAASNTEKQSVFVDSDSSAFPRMFRMGYNNPFEGKIGASVVLDSNVLADFTSREESDFWVLPVSISEIYLLDANQYNLSEALKVRQALLSMLRNPVSYDIFKVNRGSGRLVKVKTDDGDIEVCG